MEPVVKTEKNETNGTFWNYKTVKTLRPEKKMTFSRAFHHRVADFVWNLLGRSLGSSNAEICV